MDGEVGYAATHLRPAGRPGPARKGPLDKPAPPETRSESPRVGGDRLDRLDNLSVDPTALQGDPFARRTNWLTALRSSTRGWVAAAIAVGVLVLGWQFRSPVADQVTGQGAPQVAQPAPARATRLATADPSLLKQKLVDELRASGVEAIGYDRLGLSGVDARLPQPVPEAVRATLAKYGIPVPGDGVMRVEIAALE